MGTRFSDSEHVSPTQNTFLRNFRSSEFGVSEKRVLSGNTFLRPSEHVSPTQNTFVRNFQSLEFGVRSFGKTCSEWEHVSPTQNTFLRLRTHFSEIFGVRSFGKTCSEWEHVSPTQDTFLRSFRSSEFGVSEKRVLSGNTFLRLRTRCSEIFGVRSSEFRKNVF